MDSARVWGKNRPMAWVWPDGVLSARHAKLMVVFQLAQEKLVGGLFVAVSERCIFSSHVWNTYGSWEMVRTGCGGWLPEVVIGEALRGARSARRRNCQPGFGEAVGSRHTVGWSSGRVAPWYLYRLWHWLARWLRESIGRRRR